MEITFIIPYHTHWGESMKVVGRTAPDAAIIDLPLTTTDGYWWSGTLTLATGPERLTYEYRLCDDAGRTLRREAGLPREWRPERRLHSVLLDAWMDCPEMQVFARSALADCVCRRSGGSFARMDLLEERSLLLLKALPPADGLRWGVLGSTPALGEWQADRVRLLARTGVYEWGLPLTPDDLSQPVTYKYVLAGTDGKVIWEEGPDRVLLPGEVVRGIQTRRGGTAYIRTDHFPQMPGGETHRWRGAGVVIPVFSLRSDGSFGVGDFGDLREFVRWAADAGMSAVQLLPINDTTTTGSCRDSYPYSAISVFALHPIYFDARTISDSAAYAHHKAEAAALNELPQLDYEAVWRLKSQMLHELFQEEGDRVRHAHEYRKFCRNNAHWLTPYADFCACRDYFHTADFRCWPADRPATLEHERQYHIFVQYLLHRQLSEVHSVARECGVMLKGDIPIGICRDSVPAREDSGLFHFDGAAGAPPDAFATQGQNWGFPTYNWEAMAADGYGWWRRRLAHTAQYFDAYRIDHVLGFFRIWEIPVAQRYGTLGHFRPALPLSCDEIRAFGFTGHPDRFARPIIVGRMLEKLHAICTTAHLSPDLYLETDANGDCRLRPDFSTQAAIYHRLPHPAALRDALLEAAAEVLFIEDSEHPGQYHPRVMAHKTAVYENLSAADRQGFDRLHEDFFYVRHNDFWAQRALEKLPAVINYAGHAADNTERAGSPVGPPNGMLPCAEDLGMIPDCVRGVLEQLGILSLEIQRMPKQWGVRFARTADYPYMSVATPGTHDMAPFRLWWRESAPQTQAYWQEVLHRSGEAPADAPADACEQMVADHLAAPSMLCLIALQDLLGMDARLRHPRPEEEQINCPADPNHYWRYRMHLTLEALRAATPFNEKLRALIRRSGRANA